MLSPVCPPFPPQPNGHSAAFWQCCAFLPASVTTQWLMLLFFSITSSTAPCVSSGPLLGSLSMDSAVYCFLLQGTFYFCCFCVPSALCYMLCFAVPCSHSVALFHVPNDCSSLFEKCLLKTHCPYTKEWNKEELVWLGEPGKYSSPADESSLSRTLVFQNSWTC